MMSLIAECGRMSLLRICVIARPILWINTVGPAWVGMWLTGDLFNWSFLPILLWLTLPFNLLIYGVNDISDQDTDALNSRKGGYGGALIKGSEARKILAWVIALNFPFAIYFAIELPASALVTMFMYMAIFLGYSLPPRFKALPFFDSLSNSAYALPVVFVPLALAAPVVWPAFFGLMFWSMAKHTYDAIQDIDEDQAVGVTTTAVFLGIHGTLWWCGLFWLLSSLLFGLMYLPLGCLNFIYAAFLLRAVAHAGTAQVARRVYAFSVAYPYVVGTFGGVVLAWSVFRSVA